MPENWQIYILEVMRVVDGKCPITLGTRGNNLPDAPEFAQLTKIDGIFDELFLVSKPEEGLSTTNFIMGKIGRLDPNLSQERYRCSQGV